MNELLFSEVLPINEKHMYTLIEKETNIQILSRRKTSKRINC